MYVCMYEGVASAFHGVNHTMGGYPRTSKPCNWYIYALVFRVNFPPSWYGPPDPGPRHNIPPLGYSRLLAFHICLLFPHLVKFLANTMQFNTTCNDYDSISQHSHQSTRTTGPQGGRGANHDNAQGGKGRSDAGAYNYSNDKSCNDIHAFMQ